MNRSVRKPAPTLTDPIMEMVGVSVVRDQQTILTNIDWALRRREHWVVLGPNGGGKSTLLAVAGLQMHPTKGRVTVLGLELGKTDIRPLRSRVGLSGNGMAESLRPALTAEEVVRCGKFGALEPWWHQYTAADTAQALAQLDRVGLKGMGERSFGTLSSGERQRTLLARALFNEPEIVFLDEPNAGLDLRGREELIGSLRLLAAEDGPGTVLVTHHVEDIPATATHLLAVADGRVVAVGELASTLSSELLTELFALPIELTQHRSGRYAAVARPQ